MYPFERFSENAKRVLTLAQDQAERSHRSYIGTEHLVLGMIGDRDGIGGRAMQDLGVDEARLRSDIETEAASAEQSTHTQIIPTSRVKRVIELSFDDARREGRTYVGTEHLLLAVLAEGESVGSKVLAAQGVTADRARQAIERVRSSGVEERAQPARPDAPLGPKLRQVTVDDARGRAVRVDLFLPADYSDGECDAAVARVRDAIHRGETR